MKARKFVNEQMVAEFKLLYESGESTCSIAKKFSFDNKTVYRHLRKLGLKLRSKREAIKLGVKRGRIKIPIEPHRLRPMSKKLIPEKAYVLGVLAGDGWLSYSPAKRRYQIGLETIDEEFADAFWQCLNKVYGLKPSKRKLIEKHSGWKDKYCVRLCCKAACEDLLSYGVPFKQDGWLVPPAIKNASPAIQASYLRGFFDSEGSMETNGRRIRGTSSHLPGLEGVSALLRGLRIRSRIIRQSKNSAYDVRIQDRASVELFAKHVSFTINRKKGKLQRSLNSYKLWTTPPSNVLKLEPEMRRLRDLGLAYEEIAKQLSLSMGTVWRHLNKNDTSEVKAFICSSNRNTTL